MEQNNDTEIQVELTTADKKPRNSIWSQTRLQTTIAVVLFVLTTCSIGLGIYSILNNNSQSAKLNEQIEELKSQLMPKEEKLADNSPIDINVDTAHALIDPYLGVIHDNLTFDIFDLWSYENTALYVAYLNAKENNNFLGNTIGYDLLNQEYKYLFGSNKTLEKNDYNDGFYAFNYTDDGAEGSFEVEIVGGGGSSDILFSVIKDVYKNTKNDAITVEVYHDHMVKCSDIIKQHCTNENLKGYYTEMNPGIEDAIASGDAEIYKMVFRMDGDHYILDSITK